MRKICFSSSLLISFFSSFSQDPAFVNANQSLLYMNPSFAGSNGGVRNQFSFRNQWPSSNFSLRTSLNAADVYLPTIKSGLAVSVLSDNLGDVLKTNVLSVTYAKYFSAKKGDLKIIPSVQFSYAKRSLAVQNLHFGETIDPRYGSVWTTTAVVPLWQKNYFDCSAGLLLNYRNRLYIGGSVFHINQPDIGVLGALKIPCLVNAHISYNFTLSKWSNLQALYIYQNQNKFSSNQLAINLISFKHLITGVVWTVSSAAQFNLGYRHNYFTVVAGYGIVTNKLAGNTFASWELHASFNLRSKEQRKVLTSYESW